MPWRYSLPDFLREARVRLDAPEQCQALWRSPPTQSLVWNERGRPRAVPLLFRNMRRRARAAPCRSTQVNDAARDRVIAVPGYCARTERRVSAAVQVVKNEAVDPKQVGGRMRLRSRWLGTDRAGRTR